MTTFATDAACRFISSVTKPRRFFLQANYSGNKKVTSHNFITGYGKTVVAECIVPRKLFKRCFNIFPEAVVDYYKAAQRLETPPAMTSLPTWQFYELPLQYPKDDTVLLYSQLR